MMENLSYGITQLPDGTWNAYMYFPDFTMPLGNFKSKDLAELQSKNFFAAVTGYKDSLRS